MFSICSELSNLYKLRGYNGINDPIYAIINKLGYSIANNSIVEYMFDTTANISIITSNNVSSVGEIPIFRTPTPISNSQLGVVIKPIITPITDEEINDKVREKMKICNFKPKL